MYLRSLTLTGFRNLVDTALEVPREGVAIVGRNAQGKTNLLEAIQYLETFRSFRGARDEQLVRFGGNVFRIVADLASTGEGPRAPTITAAYEAATRGKKVTADGEEVARLGDAIGRVGAVLFTPEDVRLISDGPQERRRFLDQMLSLNASDYLASLQRFRHVLSQRNAALRDRAPSEVVGAWDNPLVQSGAEVSWERLTWIRELGGTFAERYREISDGVPAHIVYESSIPDVAEKQSVDEVAQEYRAALLRSREQEASRRTTVVGPHRDELRFFQDGDGDALDLRDFGSGGQRRTAALTLRLLEVETVRRRRGREPILLLDDVFAELDEGRSARVLDLLDRVVRGQVLLTAPKESDVRFRGDTLARWTIEQGRVDA